MKKRRVADITFYIALLWVMTPLSAHAYLDPGTGNYVIQVVMATLLGGAFAIKSFWGTLKYKVMTMFSKNKGKASES